MQSPIYAFILNFRNRTYVAEVHGVSIREAMTAWADSLDPNEIRYLSDQVKRDFLADIQDEHPVALKGLANTWMFVVSSRRMYGHVYVAKIANEVLSTTDQERGLYTFVMNFEGGEYVSQVHAKSVHDAVLKWGQGLSGDEIEGLDKKTKDVMLRRLKSKYPNTLLGIVGAWSFTVAPLGRFASISVIKTSEDVEEGE